MKQAEGKCLRKVSQKRKIHLLYKVVISYCAVRGFIFPQLMNSPSTVKAIYCTEMFVCVGVCVFFEFVFVSLFFFLLRLSKI